MRDVTLIYCLRNDSVLLGMKKRGFGAGKFNGYGGKVETGESIENSAVRELFEESGVSSNKKDLKKVAEIDFYFSDVPKEKNWDQTVHVFLLRNWKGEPRETEEMKPEWHKSNKLPMDKMWIDDQYWLPKIFQGEKIKASFTFGKEGASVINYKVNVVKHF